MTKLDFPSVTWRDAGSYVCLAENAGGRSQKQVEITVLCKFTFLEFYSTSSTLNKLSPCHTPSLLNWCSPYHTTFTHIGLSLQLQPLQFGPCQTAFTLIYLPLSHMHSVTIYLQPQLESSLSHFFHLHNMTSPKLYPVLSALSLVVFEYDVQAHPCRLGSLCCVLGQDTLLPKCLAPPGCLNGYQQMLRWTLLWISMLFCSGE